MTTTAPTLLEGWFRLSLHTEAHLMLSHGDLQVTPVCRPKEVWGAWWTDAVADDYPKCKHCLKAEPRWRAK